MWFDGFTEPLPVFVGLSEIMTNWGNNASAGIAKNWKVQEQSANKKPKKGETLQGHYEL